jgi:myotubularin-related protein 5/13
MHREEAEPVPPDALQPHGWRTYTRQEAPTFFVSVLTDMKAQRRYCACLTFLEPTPSSSAPLFAPTQRTPITPNTLDDSNLFGAHVTSDDYDADDADLLCDESLSTSSATPIGPSRKYSPKSLVLISRLDYFDLFKSCLSLIYGIYVDNRDTYSLESLITNLLTTTVPSPGSGLTFTFSLGADDRHAVQSTSSTMIPNTGASVYNLFKELGINHVLKLLCAILSDFKILFFSRSYSKLTEACNALESLLYPLKYTGVYVPILPCFGSFLEFPSAPTPYIIGVHSSYQRLIEDMHSDCLHEVIKVDLDGSSVSIPPTVDQIANLPEYLHESTVNLLFSILKPEVLRADQAFPTSHYAAASSYPKSKSSQNISAAPLSSSSQLDKKDSMASAQSPLPNISDPVWLDKQIRAVFVRLFAQLFAGYRYCLLTVRINPKPVICFHKANFLGHHELVDNEFMNRLLDSMSFVRFIEERGPPYRAADLFDHIYAAVQSQLRDEALLKIVK